MLYNPGTAADASPPNGRPLKGRYLAHSHRTKIRRAFEAADLVLGRAQLTNPTIRQAALLNGVSVPYVAAAKRIAFEQPHLRSSVESGQQRLLEVGHRQLNDYELDRLVTRIGADRLMAALDRYTQPKLPLVAAE
jgi:hypothetical protein